MRRHEEKHGKRDAKIFPYFLSSVHGRMRNSTNGNRIRRNRKNGQKGIRAKCPHG
jgi:hypothetical protein